jgi:hypothetical protein
MRFSPAVAQEGWQESGVPCLQAMRSGQKNNILEIINKICQIWGQGAPK